jgi:predicted unusual protein kinase regulating ubiquinone biosynthesis (AarF/ABC1/UbiB family)
VLCCAVGNLLVLPDGRVGFIDFGIVGRISPVTWQAMEALLGSLAIGDYNTMARALATIGACRCVQTLQYCSPPHRAQQHHQQAAAQVAK